MVILGVKRTEAVPCMNFHLILIILVGTLIILATLLRLFAPSLYDRYVMGRDVPVASSAGKSSTLAAVIVLIVPIFIAVHLWLTGHKSKIPGRPPAAKVGASSVEVWIGFVIVATTGIILWLHPLSVASKLSRGSLDVYLADVTAKKKIKFSIRAMGTLFLLLAARIVWLFS
jgi:hypothetical protein